MKIKIDTEANEIRLLSDITKGDLSWIMINLIPAIFPDPSKVKVTVEKEITITTDKENNYDYLKQVTPYVTMADQYISINVPTI